LPVVPVSDQIMSMGLCGSYELGRADNGFEYRRVYGELGYTEWEYIGDGNDELEVAHGVIIGLRWEWRE
jgi:hypothetical protein